MSDLLKEAIADAKAVRETALQNAKMALEEAFTPHLKSMLSAKLAEDDEEWVDEEGDEEVPVGEPEDEMDDEDAEELARHGYREEGDEIPVGDDEEEMGDEDEMGQPEMDDEDTEEMARHYRDGDEEVPVDIDEPEDEMGDDEEEETEGVSEEDIIEIDGVKYAPIVTEDEFDEDVDEVEELDLEAVIRELEQEIAEADEADEAEEEVTEEEIVTEEEDDEEEDEKDKEEESVEEQSSSSGIGKGTGVKQASASDEEDPGKGKVHEQVDSLQSELSEYKEAVAYLRDKLHEVNILNAKLLYTNRLFREFALSNDQ